MTVLSESDVRVMVVGEGDIKVETMVEAGKTVVVVMMLVVPDCVIVKVYQSQHISECIQSFQSISSYR